MTKTEWLTLYSAFRKHMHLETKYRQHKRRYGWREVRRIDIRRHDEKHGLNNTILWRLCCSVYHKRDGYSDGRRYYRWRTAVYDARVVEAWEPIYVSVDGEQQHYHQIIGRSGNRREQFDHRGHESASFKKWCANYQAIKGMLVSPTIKGQDEAPELSPVLGGRKAS